MDFTASTIITIIWFILVGLLINLIRWVNKGSDVAKIELGCTIVGIFVLLLFSSTASLDHKTKYVELQPVSIGYFSFKTGDKPRDFRNYVTFFLPGEDYPRLWWIDGDLTQEKSKKIYREDQFNYFGFKISDDKKPIIVRK